MLVDMKEVFRFGFVFGVVMGMIGEVWVDGVLLVVVLFFIFLLISFLNFFGVRLICLYSELKCLFLIIEENVR